MPASDRWPAAAVTEPFAAKALTRLSSRVDRPLDEASGTPVLGIRLACRAHRCGRGAPAVAQFLVGSVGRFSGGFIIFSREKGERALGAFTAAT